MSPPVLFFFFQDCLDYSGFLKILHGNFLAVQWLGLHDITAESPGSILGLGTKTVGGPDLGFFFFHFSMYLGELFLWM